MCRDFTAQFEQVLVPVGVLGARFPFTSARVALEMPR